MPKKKLSKNQREAKRRAKEQEANVAGSSNEQSEVETGIDETLASEADDSFTAPSEGYTKNGSGNRPQGNSSSGQLEGGTSVTVDEWAEPLQQMMGKTTLNTGDAIEQPEVTTEKFISPQGSYIQPLPSDAPPRPPQDSPSRLGSGEFTFSLPYAPKLPQQMPAANFAKILGSPAIDTPIGPSGSGYTVGQMVATQRTLDIIPLKDMAARLAAKDRDNKALQLEVEELRKSIDNPHEAVATRDVAKYKAQAITANKERAEALHQLGDVKQELNDKRADAKLKSQIHKEEKAKLETRLAQLGGVPSENVAKPIKGSIDGRQSAREYDTPAPQIEVLQRKIVELQNIVAEQKGIEGSSSSDNREDEKQGKATTKDTRTKLPSTNMTPEGEEISKLEKKLLDTERALKLRNAQYDFLHEAKVYNEDTIVELNKSATEQAAVLAERDRSILGLEARVSELTNASIDDVNSIKRLDEQIIELQLKVKDKATELRESDLKLRNSRKALQDTATERNKLRAELRSAREESAILKGKAALTEDNHAVLTNCEEANDKLKKQIIGLGDDLDQAKRKLDLVQATSEQELLTLATDLKSSLRNGAGTTLSATGRDLMRSIFGEDEVNDLADAKPDNDREVRENSPQSLEDELEAISEQGDGHSRPSTARPLDIGVDEKDHEAEDQKEQLSTEPPDPSDAGSSPPRPPTAIRNGDYADAGVQTNPVAQPVLLQVIPVKNRSIRPPRNVNAIPNVGGKLPKKPGYISTDEFRSLIKTGDLTFKKPTPANTTRLNWPLMLAGLFIMLLATIGMIIATISLYEEQGYWLAANDLTRQMVYSVRAEGPLGYGFLSWIFRDAFVAIRGNPYG